MSTIKDVATLAGVSISTVSIIVNGKAEDRKISVETQERVLAAIRQLNYRPNVSAKKLRNTVNNEYTIAIYWASDYRTNFLSRMISGIQAEILKHKYPVNIMICPYKNDFLHIEKGLHRSDQFHAAIIANTSAVDMAYLNNNTPKIPFVLFNRFSEQYNSVTIDNFLAGEKAANLFIKNGFKDIGMVSYKDSYLAMSQRSYGFIETCKTNGISIQKKNIIATENSIYGGVVAAESFFKLDLPPKAIYCDSDSQAQGMLHSLNKNGVKVPKDLAIVTIGMGNSEANQYSMPPLTVVEIPIEQIAGECINLIIGDLDHKIMSPYHINIDTDLIIRESCPSAY
jgi:LacI family purine nucleotide synthesis repressor